MREATVRNPARPRVVIAACGQIFRFPAWSIRRILNGLIVGRGIYRGVRDADCPIR